jgi:hypothetical protein
MIEKVLGRNRYDLFYRVDNGVYRESVCAFQDRLGFAYHSWPRLLQIGSVVKVKVSRGDNSVDGQSLSLRVLRGVPLTEVRTLLAPYGKSPEPGYWFEVLAD